MREKNLYGDLRRIDRIASHGSSSFRNGGASIVVSPSEIDAIARADDSQFRPQTAFFRTHSRDPLPKDLRRDLRKELIRLVNTSDAQTTVLDPEFETGSFMTQGWGVEAIYQILLPIICGHRDPDLQALTHEYVRRVVVASSVRGFRKKARTVVSEDIWARMANLMANLSSNEQPDLVGVALKVSDRLTKRELPEVYSRLVLSMVGFTGVALEWALTLGLKNTGDGSSFIAKYPVRAVMDESQRLAPAAWKLIREQPIEGVENQFRHVVLMTSAVHRSSRNWTAPLQFRPDRWDAPSTPTTPNFLPFGRGAMLCPARQFALDILCASLEALRDNYRVELGRSRTIPRAHILFVPPRRRITIRRDPREPREY